MAGVLENASSKSFAFSSSVKPSCLILILNSIFKSLGCGSTGGLVFFYRSVFFSIISISLGDL